MDAPRLCLCEENVREYSTLCSTSSVALAASTPTRSRASFIRLGSLVTAYVRREVLLQLLGLRRSGKGYHHV